MGKIELITLRLSPEQVDVIIIAMKAASKAYDELYTHTLKVDGGSDFTMELFNKSNQINALRRLIEDGNLQVKNEDHENTTL